MSEDAARPASYYAECVSIAPPLGLQYELSQASLRRPSRNNERLEKVLSYSFSTALPTMSGKAVRSDLSMPINCNAMLNKEKKLCSPIGIIP